MKQRNKGFTLVELLVVVAVFAIVGAAITGFILSSQKSYARGANEVDIQEEAQLVSNQIQDMIIDTSLGISYKYIVIKDAATITDYMNNDAGIITDGELTKKEVWIYNKDNYYRLLWNKESKELYYEELVKTDAGYQRPEGMPEGGVLLGEYIKEFSIDLSQVASARIVTLAMTFQKAENGVDYEVNKTISFRNDILTNKDQADVYAAADIEVQPSPDGIKLSPTSSSLWPGETLKYTASLTCSRGGLPSQSATWSISEATSGSTGIANGKLTVGTDEKGNNEGKFKVTASADGYDYDASTSKALVANATVSLKLIKAIYIDTDGFSSSPVTANGVYTFKVHFTGNMIDGLSMSECGGISAELVKGSENATITSIVEDTTDEYATVTVKVNNDIKGENPTISLKFTADREGFTNVSVTTGEYAIATAAQILKLEKDDGYNVDSNNWVRMENRQVKVSFNSDTDKITYAQNWKKLKSSYYIKYIYEIRNSAGNVTSTAYSNTNDRDAGLNEYIEDDEDDEDDDDDDYHFYSSVALTEDVDFQSGSVWVTAELHDKNSGALIGTSNTISYTIPEVKIVYGLSGVGGTPSEYLPYYKSNMNVYITPQNNNVRIFYRFSEGISSKYKLENEFDITASYGDAYERLDSLTYSSSNMRLNLNAEDDAGYYSGSTKPYIQIVYRGLETQALKVYMVTSNFSSPVTIGNNSSARTYNYIPDPAGTTASSSEWQLVSGNYYYYMDQTHRFLIKYESNSYVAYLQELNGYQWNYVYSRRDRDPVKRTYSFYYNQWR